jgi:hypothetical protein
MLRGSSFADLLDQQLREIESESVQEPPRPRPPQAIPPNPFLFSPSMAASGTFRPAMRLDAAQREALEGLRALGAQLGACFDEQDLRTTYRLLALRYHPDRHPGANAVEQAHLAHTFASMCDCYQQLLTLFDSASPTRH